MNIEKLNKMENSLDKSIVKLKEFEKYLNEYKSIQKDIKNVSDYYGSDEWFSLLDEYEKGNLKDIKAGILSEDTAYDLIIENRELAIKMLEIATKILKEGY